MVWPEDTRESIPPKSLGEEGGGRCWEILKCKEEICPAYLSENTRCWLIPGTHCNSKIQGEFIEKVELCCNCRVLKRNLNPASVKMILREISKQFERYRKIVRERDEELEKIGLELAISLSEVFEALKRIASGDPSVKIQESSKIDLIGKLKHLVNVTAGEIKVIVDQCHEFAICLAEHFDVFHRVSRGDLTARVSGGSENELMESMKKVINETIDSISREISNREKAEEEMRLSEEKYRTIFDNTGTPTIIVDGETTISLANAEFEKFAGYARAELEARKSWMEFVMSDDLGRVKEWYRVALSGFRSAPAYYDFRFVNVRGSVRDTLAVVSNIPGTDNKVLSFLEMTERKHREMEAIVTMTTALRSAPTRAEMLPVVIDEVINLLKTDGASLAMLDPVTGETIIEMARGSWAHWTGVRLPQGEGISGHVIETGKPYLNNDLHSDAGVARPELIGDMRSAACVPLIAQGRAIGAIWVGRKSEIAEYEVRLLTAICEIAANAIHRSTLNEQTEQRFQRLSALHGIDMAITASLDLRVTLNILLDHVTTQLRTDAATVLLLNPYNQTLEYAASRGFRSRTIQQTQLRLGEGHAGRAALERRLIAIPNVFQSADPCARTQILAGEVFIAHHAVPLICKGQVKGVLEVFHRSQLTPDSEWLDFFEALASQAAIAIENASLFDQLQRSNTELSLAYDTTLEGWSRALEIRDKETEGHTLRVAEMTLHLSRIIGVNDSDLVHIRRGALLHDIGKMGIKDSILLKNGPLTEEEYDLMRKHPEYAYEMLLPIKFLRPALNIPYCHHEKWNGTGYPRGLKAEQIPLEARIFAVVDVWDALMSDRPYRPAWSKEDALNYIREKSGSHFDPKVAETFLRLFRDPYIKPS